ncbi:hypothetical protein PAPYR_10444 [Paratrimastix pyriformis]|uniref:Uncharacterized protein n=1 Tax=Paratrimastix pyriformis TaxID=342808 RepID=A0ABQ8UAW6_9EUKA|nr:hypothetical protein PAPYR_10444 [Paratrimastix pyriformis]
MRNAFSPLQCVFPRCNALFPVATRSPLQRVFPVGTQDAWAKGISFPSRHWHQILELVLWVARFDDGALPSDTAEACSAPPFSLGGFFRASGERSGLCFLRERAHAMLMLAGRCWVSGSRREPTDRGSWGLAPPDLGSCPSRFADLSPARLGVLPQADLEVLPAWPRVVPRDQCGLSPRMWGVVSARGGFPLFATLLAADRVFTPFTRLTRARRPVDFARHWAGDPYWVCPVEPPHYVEWCPPSSGPLGRIGFGWRGPAAFVLWFLLVASRRVCALIMGDVVYPGPPDYLCFLFDSQQAAPPLGVGSTGSTLGLESALGAEAVPLVVLITAGRAPLPLSLRSPFLCLMEGFAPGSPPWAMAAVRELVSGFACRLILRLSGARGRGLVPDAPVSLPGLAFWHAWPPVARGDGPGTAVSLCGAAFGWPLSTSELRAWRWSRGTVPWALHAVRRALRGTLALRCRPLWRGPRCDDVRCDDVRCDDVRCDDVRCDDVRCEDVRCGDVRCGDVRCGDVRCDDVRWMTSAVMTSAVMTSDDVSCVALRDDAQLASDQPGCAIPPVSLEATGCPGAAHFVAVSHGVIRGRRSFLWDDTAADAVQSQGFPHSLVGLDAFPHSSVRKPRPHGGGPLGAYRGSIPAGYGTGNSRTRKFLRGCTPGTRMTLHHHPDRVATSDFENSNFEFGVCLRKPRPHGGGPLGAYRGSIPAGYGTGNSRTRKFLRGCTRMTTQILIIQIQEFNRGRVDRSSPPGPLVPFPALCPGPLASALRPGLEHLAGPMAPRLRARPQPAQPWPVSVCA